VKSPIDRSTSSTLNTAHGITSRMLTVTADPTRPDENQPFPEAFRAGGVSLRIRLTPLAASLTAVYRARSFCSRRSDGEDTPFSGHALKLVSAAIVEVKS
jgi:hypothetical protein